MTRVLVALDGSELALRAGASALHLLGPAADAVTLVRVVSPVRPLVIASGMAMATTGDVYAVDPADQSAAIDEAETYLSEAAEALGLPAATRVLIGDPGPELCRFAAENDHDLLVVGSHGSGFLKRVVLGSVSHFALQHAPCPVLVVRGAA